MKVVLNTILMVRRILISSLVEHNAVDLKAYHGEKIEVAMFSNVYKNLLADYKVKIDDIKNRIDIDLNRFNEAS